MRQRILVWDVDNCISDDAHRMHLMPAHARHHSTCKSKRGYYEASLPPLTDEDFHRYHIYCVHDPFENYEEFFDSIVGAVPRLLFVTAMPQAYASLRHWWLQWHLPKHCRYELLMRPDGDHSCSTELKPRMLQRWFTNMHRDPEEVECAFDDRQDVLDAYEAQFNIPTKRVWIND